MVLVFPRSGGLQSAVRKRAVWNASIPGFLALSLLKNCDRSDQVKGPLQHRISHRRFLRTTSPPLRGFHGFELRILAGDKSRFV